MNKIFALILLILALKNTYSQPNTCKVIAFQDGGDNLAYQAGAFQGLLKNLFSYQYDYDVATGVSFGGLNAALIASYSKGEERKAADKIVDFWKNQEYFQFFKAGPEGTTFWELYLGGMFDTTPLQNLIEKMELNPKEREIVIGATNVDTGIYERWNITNSDVSFQDFFMASTSIATLFPYQIMEGHTYFSGSTVKSLDIESGISKCLEQGFVQSEIIVDTILSSSPSYKPWNEKQKIFDTFARRNTIQQYKQARKDFSLANFNYPNVNFRCLITPNGALPESNFPFAYKPNDIEDMITAGKTNANEGCNRDSSGNMVKEYIESILKEQNIEINEQNIQEFRTNKEKLFEKLRSVRSILQQQQKNNQQIEL